MGGTRHEQHQLFFVARRPRSSFVYLRPEDETLNRRTAYSRAPHVTAHIRVRGLRASVEGDARRFLRGVKASRRSEWPGLRAVSNHLTAPIARLGAHL